MLQSMSSFIQRRATTSSRLRENQAGPSSSNRGQRSNAPETTPEDKPVRASDAHVVRKKKGPAHPLAAASSSGAGAAMPRPTRPSAAVVEENRKSTLRPFSRSSDAEVKAMLEPREPRPHRRRAKSKRRDRSASREAANSANVRHVDASVVEEQQSSRSIQVDDDTRKLRQELEAAKKVSLGLGAYEQLINYLRNSKLPHTRRPWGSIPRCV